MICLQNHHHHHYHMRQLKRKRNQNKYCKMHQQISFIWIQPIWNEFLDWTRVKFELSSEWPNMALNWKIYACVICQDLSRNKYWKSDIVYFGSNSKNPQSLLCPSDTTNTNGDISKRKELSVPFQKKSAKIFWKKSLLFVADISETKRARRDTLVSNGHIFGALCVGHTAWAPSWARRTK